MIAREPKNINFRVRKLKMDLKEIFNSDRVSETVSKKPTSSELGIRMSVKKSGRVEVNFVFKLVIGINDLTGVNLTAHYLLWL